VSLLFVLIVSRPDYCNAQQTIGFGIHADPLVGWFTSDNRDVTNSGAKAGLNFGLTFNRYFKENYVFSAGVSLITAGGSLKHNDTITLQLNNPAVVYPGLAVDYSIKYLAVPVGIKLQSNQIGYIRFFTDVGLDPKFVLGGKAEIPAMKISKENADAELKSFNMGYHITGGIEYSLGGTTALVVGINFDSNFIDVTHDMADQPLDKILHKMLGFRLGINF
jgi:hypothetical protein